MPYYAAGQTTATTSTASAAQKRSHAARWRSALIWVFVAAALICWTAYRVDGYVLRTMARDVTQGLAEPEEQVLALNHWVHAHLPTMRNPAYFGWPRLRAAPVDVLERGGDCADKSRLLTAMLREIGIPATMAMLFDPRSGNPTHTVVEARPRPRSRMVVDTSFDLSFPNPSGSGYLGILALRRDADALHRRLAALQAVHPWPALCHFYPETYAPYDAASTINWNRNRLTRALRNMLLHWFGDEIYAWSRPVVMEEPKLLIAVVSMACAAILAFLPYLAALVSRRAVRRRSYEAAPTGSQTIAEAWKTGPSVQQSRYTHPEGSPSS